MADTENKEGKQYPINSNEILIFHQGGVETRRRNRARKISVEEFSEEVQDFYNKLSKIFEGLNNQQSSGFKLKEITINAEISASGQVGFLGTGAEAGIKGGLTFKLVKE